MKFSAVILASIAAADRPEAPSYPIRRLNRLVQFTYELIDEWYGFLESKELWIQKIQTNAAQMERAFSRGNERCGFFDEANSPDGGPRARRAAEAAEMDELRYNREDPKIATAQLLSGFEKWAERYLAECSGQPRNYQHQIKRMARWNSKLQDHLQDVGL